MSPRDGAVAVGGQSGISRRYDLARDGGVIAVLERDQQEASEPPRTIIVLNWFEELKQRSRQWTDWQLFGSSCIMTLRSCPLLP